MALYQTMLLCGGFVKLKVQNFIKSEKGAVDIVAIVVLIGIAVLLALVFKDQMTTLLNSLFETITGTANDAVSNGGGGD